MKKPRHAVPATESLPTFLDETAVATDTAGDVEPGGDEASEAPTTAEPTASLDTGVSSEASTSEEPSPAPSGGPAAASLAEQRPVRVPSNGSGDFGGLLATFIGTVALLAAGALLLAPELATKLAASGLGPATLALGGLVLCVAGMQAGRFNRLTKRLADEDAERQTAMAELQQELRGLLAARTEAPNAEAQQHLLLAVERQDDKVNNLTKAIKMYGKPMMEIANQGSELAGSLANVRTMVEGGAESTRQALARMETQLRTAQTAHKQELGDLQQGLQKLSTKLDQVGSQGDAPLAPVQQKLGQLEVALAAISQRLEDSEVRKSLLRLEEVAAKERETLQLLLRGDVVRETSTELQSQLDRATRGLTDGLMQLRENNLGGLETAVRDIQREVSGVATTVAQINATVKNGARSAPGPTTTPVAPIAATATAPAAPSASATPAAPTATTTVATGEGGGYQTGTRATASKNVLGAIAKLKQMKN